MANTCNFDQFFLGFFTTTFFKYFSSCCLTTTQAGMFGKLKLNIKFDQLAYYLRIFPEHFFQNRGQNLGE